MPEIFRSPNHDRSDFLTARPTAFSFICYSVRRLPARGRFFGHTQAADAKLKIIYHNAMNFISLLVGVVIGAALALAIYIFVRKSMLKGRKEEIIAEAENEAESIKKDKILEAKEKFLQLKSEHDSYVAKRNSELKDVEVKLKQKENSLNQMNGNLQRKMREADDAKASLAAQQEAVQKKEAEYESLREQANKQLGSQERADGEHEGRGKDRGPGLHQRHDGRGSSQRCEGSQENSNHHNTEDSNRDRDRECGHDVPDRERRDQGKDHRT